MTFSWRHENATRGTGAKPLYCLPAYMILSGIWDFIQRGRGQAQTLPDGIRSASIKQFASRGHDAPAGRLRSVAPCAACGGRRSLTGSRRCPRSMTPITGAARPRLREGACQARGDLPPAAAKGLPSAAPSVGRVPPAPYGLRAVTLPTLGGGVAPPAPPAVAVGDMWRPRPRLRRVPAKLAASRCAGAPLRNARPSPCGAGRWPGLALLLPRAGCGAGAPARPGPHKVGAVGPSAPPARSGLATASRPALARLRLCLRWCGSACARPSRRSGGAALAASRRQAGPRPAACGLAPAGARNFNAAR